MMLLHSPLERQDEIGALAAQLSFGEIGHLFNRGSALDQRLEHRPAGHAEDVAQHARQLDVGRFQKLQPPVALGRLAPRSACGGGATARAFPAAAGAARSSSRSTRAGPDRRSTRHPSRRSCAPARCGCAGRCRRSPRNVLPRRRRPVASRRLCSPCRHASLPPPPASPARLPGRASPCGTCAPPSSADPRARRSEDTQRPSLMHVQPTAPLNNHPHHCLLPSEGDRDAAGSRHCHTCSPFPGATKNGTSMPRGPDCLSGSRPPQGFPASTRSPAPRLG